MPGWDVSSTADCGRQRWAMGDERSYLDLHSFPRPLRTELHTNRHACALAVMISLRGAMPLEGAVLPQPEAEPAVLGLARPHRLPHASASSESNPDDCLGRGQPPIRSFAQTLFIIPGLQLPFIGREIGLRAFFCAWTPRIAQVFFLCFVPLGLPGACAVVSRPRCSGSQSHLHAHTSVGEDGQFSVAHRSGLGPDGCGGCIRVLQCIWRFR